MRIVGGITKATLTGIGAFYAYHFYRKQVQPERYNFAEKKGKKIVVVGSGMVGLTSAYFLSNNPLNKVVVLERESECYRATSFKNGCWLPIDSASSWTNRSYYPFTHKALFDYKEWVSRIYISSAF